MAEPHFYFQITLRHPQIISNTHFICRYLLPDSSIQRRFKSKHRWRKLNGKYLMTTQLIIFLWKISWLNSFFANGTHEACKDSKTCYIYIFLMLSRQDLKTLKNEWTGNYFLSERLQCRTIAGTKSRGSSLILIATR